MKIEIELDELNKEMFLEALEHYNLNNKAVDKSEFARMNLMDSIHDYRVSSNLDYSKNYP